jgi:UDP-N-acetylglucosamine acyltransferase
MSNIHKTAIIEDGAKIGENVTIEANAYIGKDVTIGDSTYIYHGASITGNTKIGKNNRIFSYSVLGSIPQDLKYNGERVELIIGDNNTIREFTLFNPGTSGGGCKTIIGSNNLFMGQVHIAHDCRIGNHCIFANNAMLAGHVEIDDFVVIGGLSPIHQFVKIGKLSMIAGASAVAQDIPPFCTAEGNRAVVRGLNLIGIRRNDEFKDDIDNLKKAYNELFKKALPIQEVAERLLEESNNKSIIELAKFIKDTTRGIPFER